MSTPTELAAAPLRLLPEPEDPATSLRWKAERFDHDARRLRGEAEAARANAVRLDAEADEKAAKALAFAVAADVVEAA